VLVLVGRQRREADGAGLEFKTEKELEVCLRCPLVVSKQSDDRETPVVGEKRGDGKVRERRDMLAVDSP